MFIVWYITESKTVILYTKDRLLQKDPTYVPDVRFHTTSLKSTAETEV